MNKYTQLYKTISSSPVSYFIGANTANGFTYGDPSLFKEQNYLCCYIIKGGPGTGKSTLMKSICSRVDGGIEKELYYCSSDPDSLDAVIFSKNGKKALIADATAPHCMNATMPGAISHIIDPGRFWNRELLKSSLNRITYHTQQKAAAFEKASRFISAAKSTMELISDSSEKGFNRPKAIKFADRFIFSLPKQKEAATVQKVFTHALSMKGAIRLNTFDHSKRLIALSDPSNLCPHFLPLLSQRLKNANISHQAAYTPLGDMAELRLTDPDISFVYYRDECRSLYSKVINLSRFIFADHFKGSSAKRHFNERCFISLLDGALDGLREAEMHHGNLEEIYSTAMDFSPLNSLALSLSREISELLAN